MVKGGMDLEKGASLAGLIEASLYSKSIDKFRPPPLEMIFELLVSHN